MAGKLPIFLDVFPSSKAPLSSRISSPLGLGTSWPVSRRSQWIWIPAPCIGQMPLGNRPGILSETSYLWLTFTDSNSAIYVCFFHDLVGNVLENKTCEDICVPHVQMHIDLFDCKSSEITNGGSNFGLVLWFDFLITLHAAACWRFWGHGDGHRLARLQDQQYGATWITTSKQNERIINTYILYIYILSIFLLIYLFTYLLINFIIYLHIYIYM